MAQGDTAAFDQLYDRYFTTVEKAVASKVSNHQEAEDIISEVFVRFWRGAKRFRGDAQVRTWLLTITRNAIADYYRKRHREGRMAPIQPLTAVPDAPEKQSWIERLPDDRANPEEAVLIEEERSEVVEALYSLQEHQRSILMLRFNSQLPLELIGERLGVPVGTVKSRLHRAVRALRRALESRYST